MKLQGAILLCLYVFASFLAINSGTIICSQDPNFFWTTPRTRTVLEGNSVSIDCMISTPQFCTWTEIGRLNKKVRRPIKERVGRNCSINIEQVKRDVQLQLYCNEQNKENATSCSQTVNIIVLDPARTYMSRKTQSILNVYNGKIFINETGKRKIRNKRQQYIFNDKYNDLDTFESSFEREIVYVGRKSKSFVVSVAAVKAPDICFIVEGICFRAGEITDKYIFGDFYEESHVYTMNVTLNTMERELNESLYVIMNEVVYPITLLYEKKFIPKKEIEWGIAEMPVIIVSGSVITIIIIISFYLFILPICFPDKNKKENKNRKITTSTIATEVDEMEALMRKRKISVDAAIQTETV